MRYKRTRTDAALPQPRSPHFVIFTGIPKAPASLDDVHRTRKRPQTPLDTRTQRPRPSSISARQSVSAPSTGRLSRAHKPRGDWRGGLGETRKPRISPRCQPHRSIDAPAFAPAVAMSRHFSGRSTQARHFSWNFTPETRHSSLKGTQNRASTPAIAHAGLPHGARFPRLAATATSRFAVTNGQAAPPAPSARLAAPSATAPAKAWSTRRRGIGQPNDGARGSCFQACSAS